MEGLAIQLPAVEIEIPEQVRKTYDDQRVSEMADSVERNGQLQPIVVQKVAGKHRLVFGQYRLLGILRAGLPTVNAIVVEGDLSSADVRRLQLIENLRREDLRPLETAMGIKDLMEETGMTAAQTAADLSLSPSTVSRLLALIDLPDAIKARVHSGEIPASAAYELGKIDDAAQQAAIADQIAAGQMTRDAVSRAAKRKKPPRAETDAKPVTRIKADLSGGRTITLAGVGLESLDTLIEWLEELLGRARRCRPKSLRTFLAILKDEAQVKGNVQH